MSYRGGDDGYRGSSRSDYRNNDDRNDRNRSKERSRYRSRSRSRERKEERRWRDKREERRSDHKTDTKVREMSISPQRGTRSSTKSPSPPPPPIISKVSMEFKSSSKPLKMTLNPAPSQSKPAVIKKPVNIASVFNEASDEEPEEMPPEARMRMRNIGRDTPTSAGPNSYGKTKHGFCDQKAITQKSLKVAMEQANPAPPTTKFPGTIYKLGPQ